MSIKDFTAKIKPFFARCRELARAGKSRVRIGEDLFVALMIVIVGLASFGLGRLSAVAERKTPVVLLPAAATAAMAGPTAAATGDGTVFASKSGTKYYYPWCSGADRILAANRVWFAAIADAKAAGLEPAANCPGLE